jgi:hypothetical protein
LVSWEICYLVITVSQSSAFKVEFPGLDFIQPVHQLVFQVFNFVFNIVDLGGEPIGRDLQVLGCPRKNIDFNLSCESGSLFLI